jgi:hypothetical protein
MIEMSRKRREDACALQKHFMRNYFGLCLFRDSFGSAMRPRIALIRVLCIDNSPSASNLFV